MPVRMDRLPVPGGKPPNATLPRHVSYGRAGLLQQHGQAVRGLALPDDVAVGRTSDQQHVRGGLSPPDVMKYLVKLIVRAIGAELNALLLRRHLLFREAT